MGKAQPLSRREFLRLSALTAATATIAACGTNTEPASEAEPSPAAETDAASPSPEAEQAEGQAAQPTPAETPSTYGEAPSLREQVEAGELPPVAERLPTAPLVIAHPWISTGNYGGTLRMSANSTTGMSNFVHMCMYGHSLLRFLQDALEIGPGLVESWEANDDTSEWTLHFREGLKWSDGEPWTTADIMYWWEDLVLNPDHSEGPPEEARSGTGTLMTLEKVDDVTLRMVFDAPAPLTVDRLAMWPNAGLGPRWMAPRHYLEQFHPTYNDQYTDFTKHDQMMDFRINPDCPTMTGWRLRQYQEGVRALWERNPYYYCVDQEGNQLPYIDSINMQGVQDAEVQKLGFLEGQVDFALHHALSLADVSALRNAQPRSGLEVRFWDSGSGTGSLIFFNHDYREEKMRELINNAAFRRALSYAYDRERVQKVVYFNTGELTTGTMSPKGLEFNINEEGQQVYMQWRDSYIEFNPDKAKALLDEIGVVDADGDGWRELPDGSRLTVRLDMPADTSPDHLQKNEFLAEDWREIGINTEINPVPPAGFNEQLRAGELMTNAAWEIGGVPVILAQPQWVVPIESTRWAPLQGTWYEVRGTEGEGTEQDVDPWDRSPPRREPEPGSPIDRLQEIYSQAKLEPDPMKRHRMVWDLIKIHIEDGPFIIGVVANYPRIVLVREGLLNAPQREELAQGGWVNPWIHPVPAVYDPEAWYWEDPEAQS